MTCIYLKLPAQFSDVLLYTSRGVAGTSRFRIRGLLPLRGMLVSAGGVGQAAPGKPLRGCSLPACCAS